MPETHPTEPVSTPRRFSLRQHWAKKQGLRRYIGPKRVAALIVLALVVGAGWYLRKHEILDPSVVLRLLDEHPVAGLLLFLGLYAVGVLTALPTIPFNLLAGIFWGPVVGGIFSAAGATVGSIVAFAMARSIFGRPLAAKFDDGLIAEIQKEFEAKSWKFVAFMRLNPVFPTGPLNYALGLTSIGAFTYIWVTFVFLVPASILVAHIGHSVGTFVVAGDAASALRMILTVSAVGTALVGIAVGVRLVNKVRAAGPRDDEAVRAVEKTAG